MHDLGNLSRNDPSGDTTSTAPDLTGALGPCATPLLVGPLELPFPRPLDVDREVPFPLPEAFVPAEAPGVIDCKPSKAPTPTAGKELRAAFT